MLGSIALTAILPPAAWLMILAADLLLSQTLLVAGGLHLQSGEELLLANSFEKHMGIYITGLALGYSALTYWIGWKYFLRFESLDSRGTEIKIPDRWETRLAPLIKKFVPGYSGPVASLIRKELGLHRVSFIMAGLLCVYLPLRRLWCGRFTQTMTLSLWCSRRSSSTC